MRQYLFISRPSSRNGVFNVLPLLLGDPWVGGGGAVRQEYPGNKPQDACCACKTAVARM